MDIAYVLDDITFTWDETKARANLRKHRVAFETAAEIFLDPFVQVVAEYETGGEIRQTAMGMTRGWQILRVAYVLGATSIRIVSARKPIKVERKFYETGETP